MRDGRSLQDRLKMNPALALLEFESVAAGLLAVDTMLKQSPVALLRCGSVHPGRYLALVGGSVASTEEAHAAGAAVGCEQKALVDEVLLPDPNLLLTAAVMGERMAPQGDAVGVCEVSTSPGLLRVVDEVLKSMPIGLVEVRLADDLGGRALVIFDGALPDVQEATAMVSSRLADQGSAVLLSSTVLPRLEETLREILTEGTRFASCANWTPAGAEILKTEG
jgi:microcompartment protein CcmL/EutN